ncbi:MAG: MFS transporter [Syntrophales bacterium]|jgi:MFS family permease|nr:MFS transporter [Syntrophales bacterium]
MERKGQALGKIFWGWYVVAGAFVVIGINYGARYCFGVFLKPMCEDLGWSRSVVSVAMSLSVLFYGIGGIFAGRLLDRFAPRWIITAGALLASLGFFLTRFVTSPLQFYLVYGVLVGLGSACLGVVVCNSSVGKWFIRKRGIAIGITTAGVGVGTLIFSPVAGIVVKAFDWQAGFSLLAIVVFVLCTGVSQIFMGRTHPEDYGLLPDGETAQPERADRPPPCPSASHSAAMGSLLGDSRFWTIAVCYFVGVLAEMSVFIHQVAYAEEYGIGRVAAASSLGIIGIASIAGRFFFGWLSDRIDDVKHVAFLGLAIMTAGMGILLFADSIGIFYLYAAVFGFGYGSIGPMIPILMADRFGRKVLGTAYGLVTFFAVGLGGFIGPIFGGLVYDTFGSYLYAWRINVVILTLVTFLILLLKKRDDDTEVL